MTKLPRISLPNIDLSKVTIPGLDKLPKMELPKITLPQLHSIDLTSLDLSRVNPTAVLGHPAVKQVTEVGFAVLSFQKAQVRRRELVDTVKARINTAQ